MLLRSSCVLRLLIDVFEGSGQNGQTSFNVCCLSASQTKVKLEIIIMHTLKCLVYQFCYVNTSSNVCAVL